MNYSYPTHQSLQASSLITEQSRQRLITAILSSNGSTTLFPEPHQQQLLEQFTRGRLTIDEVVYYLEVKQPSKDTHWQY